jgi:hypothetical protein
MTIHDPLLAPEPILLPSEADDAVRDALEHGTDLHEVTAGHPAVSRCWAELAQRAWTQEDTLVAYAFARVGYHRGLDALRKSGWRGQNPVPWSHQPNQGFLRCVALLREAAAQISERDEAERLEQFLALLDPQAAAAVDPARGVDTPVEP